MHWGHWKFCQELGTCGTSEDVASPFKHDGASLFEVIGAHVCACDGVAGKVGQRGFGNVESDHLVAHPGSTNGTQSVWNELAVQGGFVQRFRERLIGDGF